MSCISRSLIFFLESRKSGPYRSINVFSPLSWLSRYNLVFFSFSNTLFFPLPEFYSLNSFFAFVLIFLLPFFPRLDLVDQPVLLHYLHLHNFYLQVHNFSPQRHSELDPTTPALTKVKYGQQHNYHEFIHHPHPPILGNQEKCEATENA